MLSDSVEEQLSMQYNQVVGVKIGAQSSWTHANFTCVPGKEAIKHPKRRSNTEKTFLQQPTEHLREVHTEKYDHNVVVKANPTYLYLS